MKKSPRQVALSIKAKAAKNPKRVLILISDGRDNESRSRFSKVRDLLKSSDVLLYSINVVGKEMFKMGYDRDGAEIMDELSSTSGGRAFSPDTTGDLAMIFHTIKSELQNQYVIGVRASSQGPVHKWHSIKVQATLPLDVPRRFSLHVRSRSGYYAP